MDSDNALERPTYFAGQLLSAADFRAEQEYFLAKHRRHNRYLHGWGVVSGLKVTAAGLSEVIVEPGVAIDCTGNEIDVRAHVRLQIPKNADGYFVALQYSETETSPVPSIADSAPAPSTESRFTRIREGFHLSIVEADPTSGHRGRGTGSPGCGYPHPLCIARIKKIRGGWRVDPKARRRA